MKYEKVTQKPYCCTAACLEMILNRHNIPNNGQEKIAYELGLIVPKNYVNQFKKVRTGLMPKAGYGTQIQKEEYSISNFFKKHNIPLIYEYHYIDDEECVIKFLKENNCNDIIVCANCSKLYEINNENYGHMVLFDHLENNSVVILDPGVNRDIEKIKIDKVIEAIKYHGKDNVGGFLLIRQIRQ